MLDHDARAPSAELKSTSWYIRLTSELDAADASARTLVSGLTRAQLNWKPQPDVWSIGECLVHLCLSNEVYVEPIVDSLRRPASGPVDEITPGWFGRWFIRNYIEPATQNRPARAPRKAVPPAEEVDASVLDRFIASNATMLAVMTLALGHDVNRVRFRNPYIPLLRFTVGTGFQILARHNHRHLLQAERVKALMQMSENAHTGLV